MKAVDVVTLVAAHAIVHAGFVVLKVNKVIKLIKKTYEKTYKSLVRVGAFLNETSRLGVTESFPRESTVTSVVDVSVSTTSTVDQFLLAENGVDIVAEGKLRLNGRHGGESPAKQKG